MAFTFGNVESGPQAMQRNENCLRVSEWVWMYDDRKGCGIQNECVGCAWAYSCEWHGEKVRNVKKNEKKKSCYSLFASRLTQDHPGWRDTNWSKKKRCKSFLVFLAPPHSVFFLNLGKDCLRFLIAQRWTVYVSVFERSSLFQQRSPLIPGVPYM